MKIIGIIPARIAASRFPGKPLVPLCGHPMIEHVYRRARCASALDDVVITTPDDDISAAARRFGAPVVMTSPHHSRATDRVAEAAQRVSGDIVINIQGDEPLIHPEALNSLCAVMRADPALPCANLVNRFTCDEDFRSPNQIKVVCDQGQNVLFMSRQPIPTGAAHEAARLRQLGVIAFRRDFLDTYASLPQTPLEIVESIDILRAVEHGFDVRAVLTDHESFGVDTPDDARAAETRLAGDRLMRELFGGTLSEQ